MQNYRNERLPGHTPRPPQLQFATNAGLLRFFPGPQIEEPDFPLFGPQLSETGEQSPLVDSTGNVDHSSQSSTNYSADTSPYMPCIDSAQIYMPHQTLFSQGDDYPIGLPQENVVRQTGEYARSVDTAFQQLDSHMGTTSAPSLGDNGHHIMPWESSTTLPPGLEPRYVNPASPNLQAAFRAGRRSSVERHPHLEISSPATIRKTLVPRSFVNHANTSDRRVNPLEPATTNGMDPSLDLPFDGGMLDWPHGNRIDLAGTRRRTSMDSGLPDNATSRAHNSHIGPKLSEPRRHSQSSYQSAAQHHLAPALQPQDQETRRGIRGSTSPAQNVIAYGDPSLDNDEFARNPQELVEGIQAVNLPAGNPETYLYPTWQSAHRASSETCGNDRSDVSDEEVRQGPHIAPRDQHRVPTRGYKRAFSSDSPPPTTPQARKKRVCVKRKFTAEERAVINQKRKTGACKECRRAKRKVYKSSQPSLYQYQ